MTVWGWGESDSVSLEENEKERQTIRANGDGGNTLLKTVI
jgi:hypothetical protein